MPNKISSSEWEVMNVVWERRTVTAAEVWAALPPANRWAQKTVNTFLTRLVAKGVLQADKLGNVNVYKPAVSRDQCVRSESKAFLERVFRGAAGPLILHLCESEPLSHQEIQQLEKLLKAKRRKE